VDHVLELMRSGMERTMALVGSATVADLDPSLVRLRT
jgi:isopentenyl diphosphate isomerase/L-lactate dehydrogenase-like FMN-dependent dehydrogenase